MTSKTTLDGILNRRVALEQPAVGYRVAVDTVLLAAAVPAHAGQRLLDLGCGVGGAMLAVACREPKVAGVGLEIQPVLLAIAQRNVARNAFASGLSVRLGDATHLPDDLVGQFDHVLSNPPYHDEASHDVSGDAIKRTANTEIHGDLALWLASAARALVEGGILTLIHRADRCDGILALLQKEWGAVEVLPLLPKTGGVAKRVIVRAVKGAPFSTTLCHPLVLHGAGGGYTPEAEAVLREGQALPFVSA